MSENPYVPPSADLGGGRPRSMSPGSGSFEIGRCVSEAWAATWANFPVWLSVMLLGGLLAVLAAVTVIGYFVVLPVLMWGWFRYALRAYDGGARFGDVFAGFSCYGAALVATLMCLLFIAAAGLLVQSVQIYGELKRDDTISGIGLIVTLLYGFTIAPRLNLAYLYIVDRDTDAINALSQAWNDTRSLQLPITLLALLSTVFLIGGALVLGIGLFPAIMLVQLMWVSAYRQYGGAPARI